MDRDNWLLQGKEKGASKILIMYDMDEHETYPVYILPEQDFRTLLKRHCLSEGHQKVLEIITLRGEDDIESKEVAVAAMQAQSGKQALAAVQETVQNQGGKGK